MIAPPPDPKRWPALLLLAAAICPPLGTWLAILEGITIHGLTDNPWSAIGLFAFYEMALAIISIGTKVWQRLEGTWLDQFSRRVDHLARRLVSSYDRLVSGYDHHYREYFNYEHRDLDVKGLGTQGAYTLELEHIFVELRIDATPAHYASANPLHLSPTLLEGSHTIWDYLQAQQMRDQHIVVLGAPGNGKTTLLKHLGLCLLRRKPYRRHILTYTLPVLLFLREHSEKIAQNPHYSLTDAVRASTTKWKRFMPPGWIERHLDKGHCLILLDGLDEVANLQTRQQVVAWVQQQMTAYHRNRFIVTSRPYGYRTNPLEKVVILEVQSFTPTQIDKFVRNWYLANEIKSAVRNDPGVRMKADEAAEELLRRLRRTPGLIELAVNPLLLTMIATVHRYRGSLPGTRVMLYKEICEVFLGKRREVMGIEQEMRPEQRQLVIQALAYQMMIAGVREIHATKAQAIIQEPLRQVSLSFSPDTFLQSIEQVSGLLLEREQGIYIFAHLTFQEYLTMMYIQKQRLDQQLVHWVDYTWWHEVIRLYCAQAEATPIIDACLQQARTSTPALVLALEYEGEALSVQPETAKRLQDLLVSGLENTDPVRRRVVAEALLTRRIKQMVQSKAEIYVDTSLITCAEYQLFIDDQQAREKWHQPDHWEHASFEAGMAQQPVLGIHPSDAQAFCVWLTERESGIWQYRLPKKGEVQPEGIHLPADWQTSIGLWEDGEDTFTWIMHRPSLNGQSSQKIDLSLHPLNLDLRHIAQIHHTKVENRMIDLARARDLALDRDLIRTRDLAHNLGRDIARACALALARTRNLSLDRIPTLANDLVHALTLANDLARASDLANSLTRNLKRARDLASASATVCDLANGLYLANDFAHDLALTNDLASVSATVRDLARKLARDLTLARTSILNHDRYLIRSLDHAKNLAGNLASASDLIHTHARDLAHNLYITTSASTTSTGTSDLFLNLSYTLDHANTLARAKVHSKVRTNDLASALVSAHSLARALASIFSLASDLAHALNLTSALNLINANTLVSTLSSARDLAHARDLTHDLAHTLTKISFITIELARVHKHPYRTNFIVLTQIFVLLSRILEHFVLHYNTLLADISSTLFWKRLLPLQQKHRLSSLIPSNAQELKHLDLCNEIISRLEQFERRRRGEEPAYEGLLIVKERKEAFANTDDKR